MTGENLTPQMVALAEQRVNINHPVIQVLDRHNSQIAQLNQQCASMPASKDKQNFIRQNYGFLADAVVASGNFTLQPLELIAIWSRALEIFPGEDYYRQRYALSRIISGAFAVQPFEQPEWKKAPKYFLEYDELPPEINNDKAGLQIFSERLHQITSSLKEISLYVSGPEKSFEGVKVLLKMASYGDKEAKKQIQKLESSKEEKSTYVTNQLLENFRNGLAGLIFDTNDAIKYR